MRKILFMIHDLSVGGAEKVLVNLVNNMDHEKFDVTVLALFDEGVNRQFLNKSVKYQYVFKRTIPGNSHLMKLVSPRKLYSRVVSEGYDIVVSYLEGPTARIVGGCPDGKPKSYHGFILKCIRKMKLPGHSAVTRKHWNVIIVQT